MLENPEHLQFANKIAADLNKPQTTFEGLVQFLKTVPAEKINPYSAPSYGLLSLDLAFGPIVESEFNL